jgi:hypothetical protein
MLDMKENSSEDKTEDKTEDSKILEKLRNN